MKYTLSSQLKAVERSIILETGRYPGPVSEHILFMLWDTADTEELWDENKGEFEKLGLEKYKWATKHHLFKLFVGYVCLVIESKSDSDQYLQKVLKLLENDESSKNVFQLYLKYFFDNLDELGIDKNMSLKTLKVALIDFYSASMGEGDLLRRLGGTEIIFTFSLTHPEEDKKSA